MSTFTTERLKQLVSYAIKGAGFDKNIELSTYMGIRVEDGELYLNTTDGTNYVSVSDRCLADNMDIVVDADLFAKLISKINSDTVEMEVVDTTLVVKGNGKYTLALIPNESGDILSFPDKFPDDTTDIGTISASDVLTLNNTMKASLSTVAGSIYSNYYFGDNIVTTDRTMATVYSKKMFDDEYVFGRAFIELLALSTNDVTISKSNNKFVASTEISENCTISVCTTVTDEVTKYDTGAINKLAGLETPSFCRFKKAQMLDLLDRLSLFVSKFEDGAISLHFTDNSIEVSSLKSDGIESVEYTESKDTKDMTIKINIDRFRNQLKAYFSDVVDLYYGSEICIKLVDGDLTQIIALIK